MTNWQKACVTRCAGLLPSFHVYQQTAVGENERFGLVWLVGWLVGFCDMELNLLCEEYVGAREVA